MCGGVRAAIVRAVFILTYLQSPDAQCFSAIDIWSSYVWVLNALPTILNDFTHCLSIYIRQGKSFTTVCSYGEISKLLVMIYPIRDFT